MQAREDGACEGCGQPITVSLDGDLLDEWTTMPPLRCGGCTALHRAAERNEKQFDYPGALRNVVGLREGAMERKAELVAARAAKEAASAQPHHE